MGDLIQNSKKEQTSCFTKRAKERVVRKKKFAHPSSGGNATSLGFEGGLKDLAVKTKGGEGYKPWGKRRKGE